MIFNYKNIKIFDCNVRFWYTYRRQFIWDVLANYCRRSVLVNVIAICNVFVTRDKISFFAFECCLLSNTTKVFTNQVSTPWSTMVLAPVRNAHSWKDNWDYRNVIFIFLGFNGCILHMGIHIVSLSYLVGNSRYSYHLLWQHALSPTTSSPGVCTWWTANIATG